MTPEQMEKCSSAITLSDMEIFVFPELMYSLVLANIMSPVIWSWREESSFKKLKGKSSYKKFMRLKQYIMDEFEFNLDLETWGLTSQDRELKRFEKLISPEEIAKSNALFGYHGDEYYFDVDIRRHFGLDKYDSDIIPYWKTETVEAMKAFRLKESYRTGAGECVSLAVLYAAAAFVVCGIPLEDIYMILTPLHSQNFIDINGGILTNNRRVVTKTMWFNGTEISNKAQRALRNENVTILAHNSGYVHCMYDEATMSKETYVKLIGKLNDYLSTEVSTLIIANFLRSHHEYHKYFQFCCEGCRGGAKYAKAEILFAYEHGSNYRIADDTFEKLINEIKDDDILSFKLPDRMCSRQFCEFLKYEELDLRKQADQPAIKKYLKPFVPEVDKFVEDLLDFIHVEAKLPSAEKKYIKSFPIELSVDMKREEVIEYLNSIRDKNVTVDLAFYAYRDMQSCDWEPFIRAALERNPVSVEICSDMSIDEVYKWLLQMRGDSIYDGKRLAQPDEVANYQTGDGLEKAIFLANIIRAREPQKNLRVSSDGKQVIVQGEEEYKCSTNKGLRKEILVKSDGTVSAAN